ncbi:MAG TPA: AI-2E family transporter, partial [Humisphaera sp.]
EHVADGPTSKPATHPATTAASQPAGGGSEASDTPATNSPQQSTRPQAAEPAPAQPPGLAGKVFGTTTAIVGGVTEVLLLLLLILAGGGTFLRKLEVVLPTQSARHCAKTICHEAEAVVLRYVATTALINLGQAAVVGLVLWWLGVPGAWLWAGLTFIVEFVPYLGAAVMMVLLAVVALTTFDSTAKILAVPGSYLLITTLQNNLVSPLAYGNRLKLNPVAVLVGVLFWWSVWGIPGAFLAVPIVATIKVAADRIAWLKPVGVFLGE